MSSSPPTDPAPALVVRPIGVIRSPFKEKVEAPRQGIVAADVRGVIEVLPELADGLQDLEGFDRVWLLYWFDRAVGYKPKVLPPRSEHKRGVFATRSPHRPNPIGLSAVRLERVDIAAREVHVRDIDLIDGTPILDIKPYIPYADAFPDASSGWLASDVREEWSVALTDDAEARAAFIHELTALDLRDRIVQSLSLGPQPHAYRRIREAPDGTKVLAIKEWRAPFEVDASMKLITVTTIRSGYRPKELASGRDPVHELHRRFVARFER